MISFVAWVPFMRRCWSSLALFSLLIAFVGLRQVSTGASVPCLPKGATIGWRTYVDRPHGFCLLYPPVYKRVPSATQEKGLVTVSNSDSGANIFIFFENKAFDLQRLVEHAPTGYDSPPEPVSAGPNTFYYYGPGGGGVSYADQYFLNLKGKTLYITFDGPYVNNKTPSLETKTLEPRLLSTLRAF